MCDGEIVWTCVWAEQKVNNMPVGAIMATPPQGKTELIETSAQTLCVCVCVQLGSPTQSSRKIKNKNTFREVLSFSPQQEGKQQQPTKK